MADIRPFRAIRPRVDLVTEIAALPYDVYSRKEAYELMKGNTRSFLRIDRPETQFPEDYDMYAEEVYQKAHDMLWDMVKRGEFIQDEVPCYYVYALTMDGRRQVGITACSGVQNYLDQIIKKHENTREEKEIDRIHHVDTCDAQTGPIFLAYRKNEMINTETKKAMEQDAVYDFVSEDGIRHQVWVIDDPNSVQVIQDAFSTIQSIYIADGHHRCASAVKVSLKRREEQKTCNGSDKENFTKNSEKQPDAPHESFLSVLFPDEELMIMSYNRVLKSLNDYSTDDFYKLICEKFDVEEADAPLTPDKKGIIGMYINHKWYKVTIPEAFKKDDPVEGLDVSILQNEILDKMLGIKDPKTDHRIDFVGGIRGLEELERRCETDSLCAFSMYPTDIHELFDVADAGLLMPPKSTWFEPKLRSGLFIHSLKD